MTVILVVTLMIMGILFMPIVIKAEAVWHEWLISGRLILRFCLIPILWITVSASLEPLSFQVVIQGIGMKERPLYHRQKHKKEKGSPQMLEMFRSLRCRRMDIYFDLGVDQDAAATALGYGALNALTQAVLVWAKQRGAQICNGAVHAHFN